MLARRYLYFLTQAQAPDGRFRNRLGYDRRWQGDPGNPRLLGPRAVGTRHRRRPGSRLGDPGKSRSPGSTPARGSAPLSGRTPWRSLRSAPPRCSTYRPGHPAALGLLPGRGRRYRRAARERRVALAGAAASATRTRQSRKRSSWPAARFAKDAVLRNGLRMLEWLLAVETRNGHLSVAPAGGWGGASAGPASTSSRSRSPHWPTRARARRP